MVSNHISCVILVMATVASFRFTQVEIKIHPVLRVKPMINCTTLCRTMLLPMFGGMMQIIMMTLMINLLIDLNYLVIH